MVPSAAALVLAEPDEILTLGALVADLMTLAGGSLKVFAHNGRANVGPVVDTQVGAAEVLVGGGLGLGHFDELAGQAAHADATAQPLVALDRHAGDPLQRLGQVLLGEVGDVGGHNRIREADVVALDVDGFLQAAAIAAGDDDLVDLGALEASVEEELAGEATEETADA